MLHRALQAADRGEAFAARVLKAIDADFDPTNSYRLSLDERENLLWTGETASGWVEFKHDPRASIWKRIAAALIRIIPIEGEL